MITSPTQAEYIDLCNSVRNADKVYYNDPDNAALPDEKYDRMWNRIKEIEEEYPDLISSLSPTQKPSGYADTATFEAVRHDVPMLSLNKAYNDGELTKFYQQFANDVDYSIEPKLDGASLSLEYEAGRLVRAVSRGDGTEGEDITANAVYADGVQTFVGNTFTGVVRGEVVITRTDFAAINTGGTFANPRNAAAGALRSKRPADCKARKCTFYAFDIYDKAKPESTDDSVAANDALIKMGFNVPTMFTAYSKEEAAESLSMMLALRPQLNYETDGVVIKARSHVVREELGATGHHPRWAVAYKTAGDTADTILRDVVWQVGKTGIVAPVGLLEPVALSGTTISRVTLHNLSIIIEKDMLIGDMLRITRAGDVIPYVLAVVGSDEVKQVRPIEPPAECPSCGTKLIEEGNSRILRCTNVSGCSAQAVGRLVHWASRAAADIDAIGPSWIESFVDKGDLADPSDFYTLKARHLHKYDKMGARNIERFITSIEASKNVGLRRAIIGLCIPFVSKGTAARLCRYYGTMNEVVLATFDELSKIEDIGPTVAKSIVDFFLDEDNMTLLSKLEINGVNLNRLPEDEPMIANATSELAGKVVVMTGALPSGTKRDEFSTMLARAGATVGSSVSGKTDYLVIADPSSTSSKATKARALGVVLISEETALQMMDA
jgi:DNA ligase (NAD+)